MSPLTTTGIRVVTPEAVELDLESAGMASRFMALFLDLTVIFVVLYAVGTVATLGLSATGEASVAGAVLYLFSILALLVVWPAAWEIGTKGRSLGKMALGLRVVTVDGAPVSIRHSVVRSVVGLFEIFMTWCVLAVAVALPSHRFRRLGDHLAGTVVVRERGSTGGTEAPHRFIPFPGWEQWSERLDVTRVTEADYLLMRRYLLRSRRLPEPTRSARGREVLAHVLGATGLDDASRQAVLAGPPEPALVAVAGAYQRRFDGLVGL